MDAAVPCPGLPSHQLQEEPGLYLLSRSQTHGPDTGIHTHTHTPFPPSMFGCAFWWQVIKRGKKKSPPEGPRSLDAVRCGVQ